MCGASVIFQFVITPFIRPLMQHTPALITFSSPGPSFPVLVKLWSKLGLGPTVHWCTFPLAFLLVPSLGFQLSFNESLHSEKCVRISRWACKYNSKIIWQRTSLLCQYGLSIWLPFVGISFRHIPNLIKLRKIIFILYHKLQSTNQQSSSPSALQKIDQTRLERNVELTMLAEKNIYWASTCFCMYKDRIISLLDIPKLHCSDDSYSHNPRKVLEIFRTSYSTL